MYFFTKKMLLPQEIIIHIFLVIKVFQMLHPKNLNRSEIFNVTMIKLPLLLWKVDISADQQAQILY